jgi:hypothetical protein
MDADGPGKRSPTRHQHTDSQCVRKLTLSPPDARNCPAAPDRGTSEPAAVSLGLLAPLVAGGARAVGAWFGVII